MARTLISRRALVILNPKKTRALDAEELYLMLSKYSPVCKFTVKKMLSIAEAIDATQKIKQRLTQ